MPEGLSRFIELFYIADAYFDDSNYELGSELAQLILDTKVLLYELISSESEHLESFVAALDDFFDFFINFNDQKIYKITELADPKALFAIINLVLNIIILDSANAIVFIPQIQGLAQKAIYWNCFFIVKLLKGLNLFSRE